MVFSYMAILTSKAFTSDHLSHVLISIFIVFLLRNDRILCVCVCVSSVLTVQVSLYSYTRTVHCTVYEYISYEYMYFLHVASP